MTPNIDPYLPVSKYISPFPNVKDITGVRTSFMSREKYFSDIVNEAYTQF